MKFSVIHPTRSRPQKSKETITKWRKAFMGCDGPWELIVSVDTDDFNLNAYVQLYGERVLISNNRSCVDAINNAAKVSTGDVIIVVSDDSEPCEEWNFKILDEVKDKNDFLLKTEDGIQDYIVTQTIMDRAYYDRDGYIYHPDFFHQFADTYLTCKADIRGRLIKSNLKFPHNHYSHLKEQPDELHKRNDATWREGQNTFVRLMKEFTPEERARIKDKSMQGFMRHVGL